MECKCGAYAKRSFDSYDDQKLAEAAAGKPVTALPCTVIRDLCPGCLIDTITVWYPANSIMVAVKPKAVNLMNLFNKQ